uniref:Uncharacterized protein n=1 Tax=Naja naja TaxID=35670 RepID=A0A8C6VBC4_NAJNA
SGGGRRKMDRKAGRESRKEQRGVRRDQQARRWPPLQDLLEEATCSICLDYFQDPVLIPECGHNFCRGCLTRNWGTSKSKASCPKCRQTFAPRSILPNRQLARVLEVARRCEGPLGEEGGGFCPKHRAPLKLFCREHETLTCVVCDRFKEHEGHSVIPAEEAVQEYQVGISQEESLQGDMKKNIVAEFRELHLWLEGREKLLLFKMEETEKDIMARKEKGLAKHMEEVRSLDHLIQEIEEKLQQPASKLLQVRQEQQFTSVVPPGRSQRASPNLEEKKRNLTFSFLLPAEEAAMATACRRGVKRRWPPLQDLLEEATCSICLDYFQDPVLIPECGHNFCRGCLTRNWGTSESKASCPKCRQTFAPRSILPNRQLARVLEVARRCEGPLGEEEGGFCPKHRAPLKLFCREHETLTCVVCDRFKEHEGHSVIPAEEAVQEYQVGISQEESLQETARFLAFLAILRSVYLLSLLLTKKEKGLAKHMEEVRSLDHLIQEIEEKLQQPVSKLLQGWKGPWRPSSPILSEALIFLPSFLPFPLTVKVTVNPHTVDPDSLKISEDQKSIKGLKGFLYNASVLGCQMFSSGRHFWDVILGGTTGWFLGVTSKPVNIKNVHAQTRQWRIGEWKGKYTAISPSERSELVLTESPIRIRISLNCEGGQVSFFDVRTTALLHTFSDASLVGETLLPYFYLSEGISMTFL